MHITAMSNKNNKRLLRTLSYDSKKVKTATGTTQAGIIIILSRFLYLLTSASLQSLALCKSCFRFSKYMMSVIITILIIVISDMIEVGEHMSLILNLKKAGNMIKTGKKHSSIIPYIFKLNHNFSVLVL